MHEMVLYYTPSKSPQTAKLKGVLVRMGIRIKNIGPEQIHQKVGYLAGIDGYEETAVPAPDFSDRSSGSAESAGSADSASAPVIREEMLVLHQFTERRLDELLSSLRKAGVRIALKALVTEHNCDWTFAALYEELKQEHAAMAARAARQAPDHSNI